MKTSLGYKETMCSPCAPAKDGEEKEYFPTLFVRSKDKLKFPEGEFTFVCRGKVVSQTERKDSKSDDDKNEESCSYDIEVYDIATKDSGGSEDESMSDKLKSGLRKSMKREEY